MRSSRRAAPASLVFPNLVVPGCDPQRPLCANSGHSSTACSANRSVSLSQELRQRRSDVRLHERLRQDRIVSVLVIEAARAVAGDKDKRNQSRLQRLGDRIARSTMAQSKRSVSAFCSPSFNRAATAPNSQAPSACPPTACQPSVRLRRRAPRPSPPVFWPARASSACTQIMGEALRCGKPLRAEGIGAAPRHRALAPPPVRAVAFRTPCARAG